MSVDVRLVHYIQFYSLDWGTLNLLNRIMRIIRNHSNPKVHSLLANLFLVPELWHVAFAVLKQLILSGNADDETFLWEYLWAPFFQFGSINRIFEPSDGPSTEEEPEEPSVFRQVLPSRRPNTQQETKNRQLSHFRDVARQASREARAMAVQFPLRGTVQNHAQTAVDQSRSAEGLTEATIANIVSASSYASAATTALELIRQDLLAAGLGGVVAGMPPPPVPGGEAEAGVAGGTGPGLAYVATRQKEKLTRTFNELVLIAMIFSRAWDGRAQEWSKKLEASVVARPLSAARLLLNLFHQVIPCITDWFKVLKYSSDPDTVMKILTDMVAACAMVGCTNYELALTQFIAQLQELKRKNPFLYDVVMRNFHALNGLFIEDQHALLTRLLQGQNRKIDSKVINEAMRVLEHRADALRLLHVFATQKDRSTWSLPTADDTRYAPAIARCAALLETAVEMACRDTSESELDPSTESKLMFDEGVIDRLVAKMAAQDAPAHVAAREQIANLPGDKMVRLRGIRIFSLCLTVSRHSLSCLVKLF